MAAVPGLSVRVFLNVARPAGCPANVSEAHIARAFAESFAAAWRDLSGSQVAAKRVIFAAAAPAHAALSAFGSSADLILPSLRVVWKIDKHG